MIHRTRKEKILLELHYLFIQVRTWFTNYERATTAAQLVRKRKTIDRNYVNWKDHGFIDVPFWVDRDSDEYLRRHYIAEQEFDDLAKLRKLRSTF